MDNKITRMHSGILQAVTQALDIVFVEGLSNTRKNAGLWAEWAQKRERFAKTLFASVALAPMVLVTLIIGDLYRAELEQFPDFIRVVLVEAVFFIGVMAWQAYALTSCVAFKAWLKITGHI